MGGIAGNLKARFFDIIPTENTYFLRTDRPTKSINAKLIEMNFAHLSPFGSPTLSYYVNKKHLYIWFIKSKPQKRKISVPEPYILYRRYSKENRDMLIKKKVSKDKFCFLIIKKGHLVSQITNSKDIMFEIIKKKYSLNENTELVETDAINHNEAKLSELLGFLNPKDIFELDSRKILGKIYEQAKLPLITLFLILNSANLIAYKYVSHLLSVRKSQLKKLITQNESIRINYEKLSKNTEFFGKFINNELSIPSAYTVTTFVYKALLASNSVILIYNQVGSHLALTISTQNAPDTINRLMRTGIFENVTVISATQGSGNKTILNLDIKIKNFANLGNKKNG